MLPFRSHRQFAYNGSPEKERRLLAFAKKKNPDGSESNEDMPEGEETGNIDFASMQSGVRSELLAAAPIVSLEPFVHEMAQSPVALSTLDLENIVSEQAISLRDGRIPEVKDERALLTEIEKALQTPETTAKLLRSLIAQKKEIEETKRQYEQYVFDSDRLEHQAALLHKKGQSLNEWMNETPRAEVLSLVGLKDGSGDKQPNLLTRFWHGLRETARRKTSEAVAKETGEKESHLELSIAKLKEFAEAQLAERAKQTEQKLWSKWQTLLDKHQNADRAGFFKKQGIVYTEVESQFLHHIDVLRSFQKDDQSSKKIITKDAADDVFLHHITVSHEEISHFESQFENAQKRAAKNGTTEQEEFEKDFFENSESTKQWISKIKNPLAVVSRKIQSQDATTVRALSRCADAVSMTPDECKTYLLNAHSLVEAFTNPSATDEEKERAFDELSWEFKREHKEKLTAFVSMLLNENATSGAIAEYNEREKQCAFVQNTNAEKKKILRLVDIAEDSLFPDGLTCKELEHDICEVIDIPGELRKRFEYIRGIIAGMTIQKSEFAQAKMREARVLTQQLLDFSKLLKKKNVVKELNGEEFIKEIGYQSSGLYNPDEDMIYLNSSSQTTSIELQRDHESGHRLIYLLSEKTNVFPALMSIAFTAMESEIPGLEEKLSALDKEHMWGIDMQEVRIQKQAAKDAAKTGQNAEDLAAERKRAHLLEEALMQYLTLKKNPDTKRKAELSTLKDLFDKEESFVRHNMNYTVEGEDTGDEAGKTVPVDDANQKLGELEGQIKNIKSFAEAYEKYYPAWTAKIKENYNVLNEFYTEVKKEYVESGVPPKEKIINLEKGIIAVYDPIKKFDKEALDLSEVEETGVESTMHLLKNSVQFVSIYDFIGIAKTAAEDIKRLWERRGKRVQATVGENIANMIPKKIPYFGRLSKEFVRRVNESNLEEANKWKEGYADADNLELQKYLIKASSTDEMRAILELLTERGRLDWNNVAFWERLNHFSSYKMPIEPCMRDDRLRDKWLHKIIMDIWGDADHFWNWRKNNDSHFESGKEDFTPLADQLSNISGGLSHGLETQLRLQEKYKETGEAPHDLNPHLYEKLLQYAISNGKMYMEDKFYYLINGVASGILTIDRLRVLAGEKGGILMRFPFIDFFYGKNNSMPEIQDFARRLREVDSNGNDTFKPGPKTTYFLQYEVLHNESVRARVSKATARVAENIDHEDMPMIVSQSTYSQMDNLAKVISGGRQKVTPEGWKNAYVGFNTKLKAYARLAELDADGGLARFTTQDAATIAESLVTYAYMDNILLQNSTSDTARPRLTWDDMKTTCPSATGGTSTLEYRTRVNTFFDNLLDELESAGLLNWNEVGVSRQDFLRRDFGPPTTDKSKQEKNMNAIEKFNQVLTRILKRNPDVLKRVLLKNNDNLLEEQRHPDKEAYLGRDDAEAYFREKNAQETGGKNVQALAGSGS